MIPKCLRDQRGFGLPEVLIASALMLVVMGAVMSLYLGTQRSARVETDFADVQDNLRLAFDQLTKDVRMAGFLVIGAPIVDRSATAFTIRTTSPARRYARITAPDIGTGSNKTFEVYSSAMVERFRVGDQVRIIRPPNQEQPGAEISGSSLIFEVSATNPGARTLSLSNFSDGADYAFSRGDMIVRVTAGSPLVSEIRYQFRPAPHNTLERVVNGGTPQILARNLSNLEFDYDFNDEDLVEAVRIAITGSAGVENDPQNKIAHRTRTVRTHITVRNI
ncbi:PilW family protein [Geoalkalibacter halelectricus]|uniref:Prepilin-type N-terminal cleavage/methylation domain-containing protein n=1 Tax=Geoalkalibacter halelectricus TaxID=2847045 RepID=A0ABY5ZNV7_9BACT|nr:prepilin-type N-terminal cleavage/methylation domain-containing protein [Geoalkalibacter halelectricus]MDO3376792.1 prepilin-type N-terminal cleavage/methylation domain-containing protein [Geoalkalibacter halelectricus]UWZ79565.1 prepilin-type N-terminal cleavage/methylation domain-containing protein [Geoalkalibacter halelectricus]